MQEVLAFPCRDGASQVTVHSSQPYSWPGTRRALIFRVPGDTVDMIDVSERHCSAMWGRLHRYFDTPVFATDGPVAAPAPDPAAALMGEAAAPQGSAVEKEAEQEPVRGAVPVLRCGSYDYVVVDYVALVDRSVFNIDQRFVVEGLLPRCPGFRFLVCQVRSGAAWTPIAYRHALKDGRKLFVPTRCGHEDTREWDHSIFLCGVSEPDDVPPSSAPSFLTWLLKLSKTPPKPTLPRSDRCITQSTRALGSALPECLRPFLPDNIPPPSSGARW